MVSFRFVQIMRICKSSLRVLKYGYKNQPSQQPRSTKHVSLPHWKCTMRLLNCVGHRSSESYESSSTGNKNSSRRLLQRCSLSIRHSEKLLLSEYSLEWNGLYLSDQFSFQTLKYGGSFRHGWKRASAVRLQTSHLMANWKESELRKCQSCHLWFYPSGPCALKTRSQDLDLL